MFLTLVSVDVSSVEGNYESNCVSAGSTSNANLLCFGGYVYKRKGAAVVEWSSSWLDKQEVRGSIPGLAT